MRGWIPLVLLLATACERGPLPDFDALWNFDDPAVSEERFRGLLDENPADLDYRVQLTTQLARAVGLQGRFDEAIALLDGVEGELAAAKGTTKARWFLERGRVYASSGSPVLARKPFQDALDVTSTTALDGTRDVALDRYSVDAAHMMAIVSEGKERLQWNRKAIKLAENSEDAAARGWLGSLYNNLGFVELDLGRYEDALETHRRAEAWYTEKGDARWTRVSRWAVAKTLRLLDRCSEALPIQQELETAWSEQGTADGYVFEEIAECRLVQGDMATARTYFAKAYEALRTDAWIVEHEPDRLERIEALSRESGASPRASAASGASSRAQSS